MEKRDILLQLIKYYADGNKARFARLIGVPPVNVSAWIARNKFDEEFISTKCREINPAFLVTGEGPMLKEDAPEKIENEEPTDYNRIINELLAVIATQNAQLERASRDLNRALDTINELAKNKKSPTTRYMVAEDIDNDE